MKRKIIVLTEGEFLGGIKIDREFLERQRALVYARIVSREGFMIYSESNGRILGEIIDAELKEEGLFFTVNWSNDAKDIVAEDTFESISMSLKAAGNWTILENEKKGSL